MVINEVKTLELRIIFPCLYNKFSLRMKYFGTGPYNLRTVNCITSFRY